MLKKLLALFVAVGLLAGVTGCPGDKKDKPTQKESAKTAEQSKKAGEAAGKKADEEKKEEKKGP